MTFGYFDNIICPKNEDCENLEGFRKDVLSQILFNDGGKSDMVRGEVKDGPS